MRDYHSYLTVFKDSYVLTERYVSLHERSDYHITLFYITKNNNIIGCKYSINTYTLNFGGLCPSDYVREMYKALDREVVKESLFNQIFLEEQVRGIFNKGDTKIKTFMPTIEQVNPRDIKVVGGELVD